MSMDASQVNPEIKLPSTVAGFLDQFRHLQLGVERAWINTKERVVALHAGEVCTPKRVTLVRKFDTIDKKEIVRAALVVADEKAGTEKTVVVEADQVFLEDHDLWLLEPDRLPSDKKQRLAHDEVIACLGALQVAEVGQEIPVQP